MVKDGYRVFDSDFHIVEPDFWRDYIDPAYKDRAPRIRNAGLSFTFNNFEVDGRIVPVFPENERGARVGKALWERVTRRMTPGPERGFDLPSTIEAMDRVGIQLGAAFATWGLLLGATNNIDAGLALAICRAYNEWLYDFCTPSRGRLLPVAMLAPHNVEGSVKEMRRCVQEKGFVGAWMRPHWVNGRNWHDPHYDPIWAEAERLEVPLAFHGAGVPWEIPDFAGRRFRTPTNEAMWLGQVFAPPHEMAYAVACVIGGGILDRFPKLRVACLEANCSWLPYLMWRMDEYYEIIGRHEYPELKKEPSEYLSEGRIFISVETEERLVRHVIEEFGDDFLVYSADYPHVDSKYPEAVETFLKLPIPEKSKKKILWDNTARLWGQMQAGKSSNVVSRKAAAG